jgi:hypothetical protein
MKDLTVFFSPAEIPSNTIEMDFDWGCLKEYKDLQSAEQKIIQEEMIAERHLDFSDQFYCFQSMEISQLPASIYEIHYREALRVYDSNALAELSLDSLKTQRLQFEIKKHGYNPLHPIILEMLIPNKFHIGGGNHRLQALRNLIKTNEINDTSIPVLIYVAWQLVLFHDPSTILNSLPQQFKHDRAEYMKNHKDLE